MLAYFDTSAVLAIILAEKKSAEAFAYSQETDLRFASFLLKIETLVVLRRLFALNKNKLDRAWLAEKTKLLSKYLEEVNYKPVDEKIETEISLRKELANCRTLDAIHVASALKFRDMFDTDLHFYTFDKAMHALANFYKFKTNRL
jgi:predicted nucleic acid-binding protein